ncbi:MAG: hypothetical protein CVV14_05260 [Gammaproteobacteria bacterium HGW-Gammaproteobacteria-4]|nr:MAG: hypothetical protein CVV14_05260 [Gammaproteobacteria bacterium HGW-Gammaproteobacteria-4]
MPITREQTDAVAKAIMEPDLTTQQEIRNKRERAAQRLANGRRIAVFSLAGFAAGALIGQLAFGYFVQAALIGGIGGGLLGRWLLRRRGEQ